MSWYYDLRFPCSRAYCTTVERPCSRSSPAILLSQLTMGASHWAGGASLKLWQPHANQYNYALQLCKSTELCITTMQINIIMHYAYYNYANQYNYALQLCK